MKGTKKYKMKDISKIQKSFVTAVSNGIDMKGTKKSPKSAFSERKRPKKGEKVIFKNFQHPMLWGVYPEVLMALAQNS